MLTPGEYRRGENRVQDDVGNRIFSTPASGDVPELMRQLGVWLTTTAGQASPPVAAALAHLEFVAIHPFNDGNGRTARTLARLMLVQRGYALDGLVSLDAQLDLDRSAYFSAIREAIGEGRRAWLRRDAVRALLRDFDHAVGGIMCWLVCADWGEADGIRIRSFHGLTARCRPHGLHGLAFAWVNCHIRAGDYIGLSGRTPQSATRDLASAVAGGWLLPTGEKRGRYYVLGPRLLETPARGEDHLAGPLIVAAAMGSRTARCVGLSLHGSPGRMVRPVRASTRAGVDRCPCRW